MCIGECLQKHSDKFVISSHNESQYNTIRGKSKLMDQISIISLKSYRAKNDSPQTS